MFPSVALAEEVNYHVAFYASESGWKWQVIESLTPHDICDETRKVQPPMPGMSDFPSWMVSSH